MGLTFIRMQNEEVERRELVKLIMDAALQKINELGFIPMLRERDALDNHSGRHHIVSRRVEYLYVGSGRLKDG